MVLDGHAAVSLTLSGIHCKQFGSAEQAVPATAVASLVDGLSAGDIGEMECANAVAMRRCSCGSVFVIRERYESLCAANGPRRPPAAVQCVACAEASLCCCQRMATVACALGGFCMPHTATPEQTCSAQTCAVHARR